MNRLDYETRVRIFCEVMSALVALAVVIAACPPNVQDEFRTLLHLGIDGLAPLCVQKFFDDSDFS